MKNRRKLMKTSAAIGAGYFVAAGVAPKKSLAAIETISFASIGVGGKGTSDSNDAGRSGDMIAICDIDDIRLEAAAKKWPKAKKYNDYRKLYDEVGKTIDAVTVSTPDHSHAPATALALRMGKACFTQKPLTHSIYEARRLGELAKEHNCVTQMGNQGTANPGLRRAAALIQTGILGDMKEVHVWTNRPVWPQGIDRPTEEPPKPSHIHWGEFIGPAKFRPYHDVYQPFKWRGWWDFGTGALGDMACHTLNMPYFALKLAHPLSVVAETSGHNKETYPSWSIIDFKFPKNELRGPITLKWYDGGKLPPEDLIKGSTLSMKKSGTLIVGSKASLYSPGDYAAKFEVYTADGKVEELPDVEYKRSPGHFQEWVQAIKGGEEAMSNFPNYAGPLTETILLGNLAVWADGKKIEWDAKNLKATNAPEVASIIKHEYRDGWSL